MLHSLIFAFFLDEDTLNIDISIWLTNDCIVTSYMWAILTDNMTVTKYTGCWLVGYYIWHKKQAAVQGLPKLMFAVLTTAMVACFYRPVAIPVIQPTMLKLK